MKNSTKLKIIRFVEKLIGYEQPPIQTFETTTKRVHKLNFSKSFTPDELATMYLFGTSAMSETKKIVGFEFIESALKAGALVLCEERFGDDFIVRAEMDVLVPEMQKR